jgi:hypothetical protein
VRVSDAQSGAPIAGAAIGTLNAGVTPTGPGSPMTNGEGSAGVTLRGAGTFVLKAARADSVRSNGLAVCVHNGNDGTCGTTAPAGSPPPPPPASKQVFEGDVAMIKGVRNGHVYPRRHAPRILAGVVEIRSGGTLRNVRIRLERFVGGRCFDFSGSRERFTRARKCGRARFFSVGGSQSFSYLLPNALPRGRFVYEMEAVESNGQATKIVNGISRVMFRVV